MTRKEIIKAQDKALEYLHSELQRKQQEYEELKEELQTSKDDHAYAVELEKEVECYKQALEKIKELVKTYDDWDLLKDVQNIINEVKE